MTMTITDEQAAKIRDFVTPIVLARGLGTETSPCSVAAINLQLTGKLTDTIPDCMSYVIGRWTIGVQDAMPDEIRNSARWKTLLPFAAGTGRDHEHERFTLLVEWLSTRVLPTVQPLADEQGFGEEWRAMNDAGVAYAHALGAAGAASAAGAAWAARAVDAVDAASAAGAVDAARAAGAAGAVEAAWAARAASAAERRRAWDDFDPCGVLEQLIAVSAPTS